MIGKLYRKFIQKIDYGLLRYLIALIVRGNTRLIIVTLSYAQESAVSLNYCICILNYTITMFSNKIYLNTYEKKESHIPLS